jgi:hypothetical protein
MVSPMQEMEIRGDEERRVLWREVMSCGFCGRVFYLLAYLFAISCGAPLT